VKGIFQKKLKIYFIRSIEGQLKNQKTTIRSPNNVENFVHRPKIIKRTISYNLQNGLDN
jgi:hypothetical protein